MLRQTSVDGQIAALLESHGVFDDVLNLQLLTLSSSLLIIKVRWWPNESPMSLGILQGSLRLRCTAGNDFSS